MKSSLRGKTQNNTRIFLRPTTKYMTDLLTQKNTEHVNFQPKKIHRTPSPPPIMYTLSTPSGQDAQANKVYSR